MFLLFRHTWNCQIFSIQLWESEWELEFPAEILRKHFWDSSTTKALSEATRWAVICWSPDWISRNSNLMSHAEEGLTKVPDFVPSRLNLRVKWRLLLLLGVLPVLEVEPFLGLQRTQLLWRWVDWLEDSSEMLPLLLLLLMLLMAWRWRRLEVWFQILWNVWWPALALSGFAECRVRNCGRVLVWDLE